MSAAIIKTDPETGDGYIDLYDLAVLYDLNPEEVTHYKLEEGDGQIRITLYNEKGEVVVPKLREE